MIQLTGTQIIEGTFTAPSQNSFTAFDPAREQALETLFYEATDTEVATACEAAANAFDAYRRKSGVEKAGFLEAIAAQINELGDALLEQAHQETGLPLARLQGERARTTGQLQLFAQLLREGSWVHAIIDTAQPERKPLPKPDIRSMQVPLGPVAVFGASNFPFAFSIAGGDTASALAAGCPVVFKAHPAHPATCELVGRAIVQAIKVCNMPAGVFGMVHGASHQVGMALVQHSRIKAVGFTGSFRGGKALYDAAVRREEPIPVYAEMGSVNPVFFLPGALKERGKELAKAFAVSITLGTGQFCTNPGLFIMRDNEVSQEFAADTKKELEGIAAGHMLTEAIKKSYLAGVGHLGQVTGTPVDGEAVKPHLFLTHTAELLANPVLSEEVFGPCSVGVRANSKEEMLQLARTLKGHLTATVHGTAEDLQEYKDLIDQLQNKVGRVVINGFPTGVEVTHAMVHGGPYPATTDSRSTSVGTTAIYRFTRPLCFQGFPEELLPPELQISNPLGLTRLVDGEYVK